MFNNSNFDISPGKFIFLNKVPNALSGSESLALPNAQKEAATETIDYNTPVNQLSDEIIKSYMPDVEFKNINIRMEGDSKVVNFDYLGVSSRISLHPTSLKIYVNALSYPLKEMFPTEEGFSRKHMEVILTVAKGQIELYKQVSAELN